MVSNFYFNLKEKAIFLAARWARLPIFRLAKFFNRLFSVLLLVFLLLFSYGFLSDKFSQILNKKLLGLSLILLVMTLVFWILDLFLETKLKKPRLKIKLADLMPGSDKYNFAEFLNLEAAQGVIRALRFCQRERKSEINSSILFYFLLNYSPKLNFIFSRAFLDLKEIRGILKSRLKTKTDKAADKEIGYSTDFQETMVAALNFAQKKGHERIETGDLITALAGSDPCFRDILIESKLKVEDIENLTWWAEELERKQQARKKFWQYENLMRRGTLAKEWTAGFTVTLDNFSLDLTEMIRKNLPEIIGHQNEIRAVERILSRQDANNVLLVGETGTGRKSIIQELAKRSLLGKSLPEVNYKRVVELDIPQLLIQLPSSEEVEKTLDRIFQEVIMAGNVILVINEFHNYVGQITRPGVMDISGVISPYLNLPRFPIVAVTTFAGLHQQIEQNPSVLALFEKIEVSEISERETLILLENLALSLERKTKLFISYPALREIISLTKRYMPALPFPEKAMELLDELVVFVLLERKDRVILPEHVDRIITEKTQIPVGDIKLKERKILLNLEELVHQRIINQEEAVKEISSALQRARSDVTIRKGPMGCFLFLGPTGVGKTETSKALAEIYFGSEDKMIRLDMSEFQAVSDIPRLLGSAGQEGLLTTRVRENPFSLILLDEIEKAHPNVLNLFLQVFDEGHLTDGQNRKVDFKNSIIIATSNAGYKVILEALKKKVKWSGVKPKLLDFLFQEGIFRPEFINRFDAVITFKPLSKKNLLAIAELLLQKLKSNLKEKGIDFIITPALKEKIAKLGFSPVFGAREMRRVIQDKVENILAKSLLSGELIRGNRVEIDAENFQLKINP